MRKRHIFLILSLLLVAGTLGTLLWLRQRALPESVRLLPESDAYVFVNLKAIRHVAKTSFSGMGLVKEPEYEEFVRETGVDFERDLDDAAFAVHSIGNNEHRYSEIFNGHFDSQKLADYFRKHAKSVIRYGQEEIYEVPQENRTVRIAILDLDSVAVSNLDDGSVIRGIMDRSRKRGLPQRGPQMIQEFRSQLPLTAVAWTIARIKPNDNPIMQKLYSPTFGTGFTLVAAVAPSLANGTIQLKANANVGDEEAAKQIAENTGTFISLYQAIEANAQQGGGDPDVKAFVDSVKVEQQKDKAVLTATLPPAFLKKMFAAESPGTKQ
jgi:hypothetical protein